MDQLTVVFHPVGAAEYSLLVRAGFRAFPVHLSQDPIFSAATTEEFAARIASEWKARDAASGYVGYVTRFSVRSEFLARYPLRRATGADGAEHCIPAEHVPELNRNIVGPIEVIAEFRSPAGSTPDDMVR